MNRRTMLAKRWMVLLVLIALVQSACLPGPAIAPTGTTLPRTATLASGSSPAPATAVPSPTLTVRPAPASTATPTVEPKPLADRISEESLFDTLTDLARIRPFQGWRSSGSPGESQAQDYLARRLGEMSRLVDLGMTVEREDVPIYLATHIHDVRLVLRVADRDETVPAQAPWGHIDNAARAAQFDTDERIGDTDPNPVTTQGAAQVVATASDLDSLSGVSDKVLFVDYVLLDQVVHGSDETRARAAALRNARPAAIVLVTAYGEQYGQSTGLYALDRPAPTQVDAARVPVAVVRLEDLAALGIHSMADLVRVQEARLTVDVDVLSPASSANLVARIPSASLAHSGLRRAGPGRDEGRALILGAHVDSANTPGALDDGSGAAVLLEVARALDEGGELPPATTYLVWFGAEELGLYGSLAWANAHPDVVRESLAAITFDSLAHPPMGYTSTLKMAYWSDGLASQRSAVPGVLAEAARAAGVDAHPSPSRSIISDYAAFASFGVPCLNVAFEPVTGDESALGVQYTGHLHCPYDDLDLARLEAPGLVAMARLAAVAVSELPGREAEDFREFPTPTRRALFVGSHTEPAHMMPAGSPELGRLLAAYGYAVDTVPYGTPVTADRLRDAALVVAMPTLDYADARGAVDWSPDEVRALEEYVRGGGLLVLVNSALRLKYRNWRMEGNEDTAAMNALAGQFGVHFGSGGVEATSAAVVSDHPLVEGLESLPLTSGNAVSFSLDGNGQVLARAGGSPVVALVDAGSGKVLVLGDMGLLGSRLDQAYHPFWRRLAQYAKREP